MARCLKAVAFSLPFSLPVSRQRVNMSTWACGLRISIASWHSCGIAWAEAEVAAASTNNRLQNTWTVLRVRIWDSPAAQGL
ncbi:hypothetical protein JCM14124_09120 [Humidesulfovibrio idahonensis]